MSNYINSSTWIWSDKDPVTVKVTKTAMSYYIKFEAGHSNVDITVDRKALADLRDKINEVLLQEGIDG